MKEFKVEDGGLCETGNKDKSMEDRQNYWLTELKQENEDLKYSNKYLTLQKEKFELRYNTYLRMSWFQRLKFLFKGEL